MSITFDLPKDVEQSLRREFQDLDKTAKEAALVELYRQAKLTHHQLAQSLGLSRLETDAILKKHRVTENLPSTGELERQVEDLRRSAGK